MTRINGNAARAARLAARKEPIEYEIGDEVFTFRPEMPLDVLFGVEKAFAVSLRGLRIWMLAHLLVDSPCDTTCVDMEEGEDRRACAALASWQKRMRAVRVDGDPLDEADVDAMWDAVREALDVTEGESSSSAGSSETAGETSSVTSDTATTPQASSSTGGAASVA